MFMARLYSELLAEILVSDSLPREGGGDKRVTTHVNTLIVKEQWTQKSCL